MATDEKEQCKPPCKANTSQSPWLVQQSESQGGRAPLVFRLGGQLPPPSPPGSYASALLSLVGVASIIVVIEQSTSCCHA